MKRKLLTLTLPLGLLLFGVYLIVNRFVEIPDAGAYPMMIVSILLMLAGIVFWVYRSKKGKHS